MSLLTSPTGLLIPVSVATLIPDQALGVDLFLRDALRHPRLYREGDYPLTESDVQELLANGVTTLYISGAEHSRYQQHLRSNLPSVVADERLPMRQRFVSLNEVVRDVLGEVFKRGDVDETVRQVGELGSHTVSLICRDDVVASDLCGVLYHDYQTFTHSANVAFYCVMLARELGISNHSELLAIAVGALLHDLGKLEIPDSILTKPARLTDSEFEVVKRHPTTGFLKLCRRNDLSFGQLMMVYQHHERLDGSGYPTGLVGEEIHSWARICAVADVFEALTSDRPYRAGMSFAAAFEIMEQEHLDQGIRQCWQQLIRIV